MENEPKEIYLNTGDIWIEDEKDEAISPNIEFSSLDGVTWSKEKIYPHDIKFVHHSEVSRLIELAVRKALEVASEKAELLLWRDFPKEHSLVIKKLSDQNEDGGCEIISVDKHSIISLEQEIISKLKNEKG